MGEKSGPMSELLSGRDLCGRELSVRPCRRERERSRGQSAAEFVMILPVFLMLVVGVIEMGHAWRLYQVTTSVSREGARQAMLTGTTQAEVLATVNARIQSSGLDPARATIVFNDGQGLCEDVDCSGESEAVRVEYPYTFPVLGNVANLICGGCGESFGSVTIASESVMRNE